MERSIFNLGLKATLAPLALTALAGCGHQDFLHFQPWRQKEVVNSVQNVREIRAAEDVDILWVIDNSASMGTYQTSVASNTLEFMQTFSKSSLKWRMGLISTDITEAPYLGFGGATALDWQTPDPVNVFRGGVGQLGTGGDSTERPLQSILTALENNHDLARPGVPMAVMIVTDAEEQSELNFQTDFLAPFKQLTGDKDKFFVYQVLNANDLGCDGESGQEWDYKASPYEALNASAYLGRVYPLCSADFGKLLAAISNEIVQNVSHSVVYLQKRPKPQTIKVTYLGKELKSGDLADGGIWTYDFDMNAIVFHDLSFSTNSTDSVGVDYEVDDGYTQPNGPGTTASVKFDTSGSRNVLANRFVKRLR